MPQVRIKRYSTADLLSWPPSVGVVQAGHALGLSRIKSYEMAKDGTFPVPVLKLGHRLRVPTAPLLRYLGIERQPHTADTHGSTSGDEPTNTSKVRRSIDPHKRYRIKGTGEVVTGAELLRRWAAS